MRFTYSHILINEYFRATFDKEVKMLDKPFGRQWDKSGHTHSYQLFGADHGDHCHGFLLSRIKKSIASMKI